MADFVAIKRLPVFKVGTHRDSKGKEITVTEADLDGIMKNFEADRDANYRPPVVLGHPERDAPRYGDFASLDKKGGMLLADVGVVPELHAALKKGAYPDRSLRLQSMSDGTYRIRHLGLLGVAPPAVQGLPSYQFAADEDAPEAAITIDFSEASAISRVGRIFQRLRDWLIETHDQDTADRIVDGYDIDELKNIVPDEPAAGPETTDSATMAFSQKEEESMKEKEIEDLKAELAAERAKREAIEKEGRQRDFSAFLAELQAEGRLTPATAPAVLDFMEILSGVETFDFAEQGGEGEAEKRVAAAPVERFKAMLRALPKVVEFSEFATKDRAPEKSAEDTVADGIASASPRK